MMIDSPTAKLMGERVKKEARRSMTQQTKKAIEMDTIRNIFHGSRPAPLFIGAVKSSIGHTETAAGVASMLKVVAMLSHGKIAPNKHLVSKNLSMNMDDLDAHIPTQVCEWTPPIEDQPRYACISSYGITGTNGHAVIAEYQPTPR